MKRVFFALLLSCFCLNSHCQSLSGPATEERYTIAQKHLLVSSAAGLINLIGQNSLDPDSVTLLACTVTGVPFLAAYADDYDSAYASPGWDAINAGNISAAVGFLNGLKGQRRLQLLIELGKWYLYKAGTHKSDLDSANRFIKEALTLSTASRDSDCRDECLYLTGEWLHQSGDEEEAKKSFHQLILSSQKDGNKKMVARIWHRLGRLNADMGSADLVCLNKSLGLYRELQLKEMEIELLWEIAAYHVKSDKGLAKKEFGLILQIQQATGFKHSLFVENVLSYVCLLLEQRDETLVHMNTGMQNLEWSGMRAVEGTFFIRMGAIFATLGENDKAITWFKKALENRSQSTHIFWYKTLFWLAPVTKDPKEALSLIQGITKEYPPLTLWEKGQVLTTIAYYFRKLNKEELADQNYQTFLQLVTGHPEMDRFNEFWNDYMDIAQYYISKSNVKAARPFLNRALAREEPLASFHIMSNMVLFQLDSAEGNYKSAMNHHILYKIYDDSNRALAQRKTFDELAVKYGAEQKDKDIQSLEKEKHLQSALLVQERDTRNWILGGIALLLVIVGLLAYNARIKQRTNKKLEAQRMEIENQNGRLRHLVAEKDWLMKEIHHRVKNNLQTITGLLGAQSDYLKNEVAIGAITDSQRRIQSMSLTHQMLYQKDNLSTVSMPDYIHELVDALSESSNSANRVRFDIDVDTIEMNFAHCIAIGLILNEAITNSFKYAFPENINGMIAISFKQISPDRLLLSIRDNGVGLPISFTVDRSGSMGMNLMRGLSKEIGADFKICSEDGTQIMLVIPYDPEMENGMLPITEGSQSQGT